ncbi:MAG: alpha/beta hydrolase [Bacteroidota bacterium]
MRKLRQYFNQELNRMTLVVMGSEDYLFLKHAKRFTEQQAQAFLVIVKNSGHIVNIERRKTFNDIALEFLLDAQQTVEKLQLKYH